jgi:hypothetical protein
VRIVLPKANHKLKRCSMTLIRKWFCIIISKEKMCDRTSFGKTDLNEIPAQTVTTIPLSHSWINGIIRCCWEWRIDIQSRRLYNITETLSWIPWYPQFNTKLTHPRQNSRIIRDYTCDDTIHLIQDDRFVVLWWIFDLYCSLDGFSRDHAITCW